MPHCLVKIGSEALGSRLCLVAGTPLEIVNLAVVSRMAANEMRKGTNPVARLVDFAQASALFLHEGAFPHRHQAEGLCILGFVASATPAEMTPRPVGRGGD